MTSSVYSKNKAASNSTGTRKIGVNTTNTIDYAVKTIEADGRKTTHVVIERLGKMAMPLEVMVTYTDGDRELFYAPLEGMRGAKPAEGSTPRTMLPDHRWVDLTYEFDIPETQQKNRPGGNRPQPPDGRCGSGEQRLEERLNWKVGWGWRV